MFSLERLSIDPNGRLIIAKIKLGDEDLSLASVYAPCDSQHQVLFTQNLCTDTVSKTNTSRTTIARDWNTTLYSVDKRGGRQWKETIQYRNSLLSFMDELGFVDVYRVLHPQKKALTYESKSLKLKSRTAENRFSIASDHKAINLSVEINDAGPWLVGIYTLFFQLRLQPPLTYLTIKTCLLQRNDEPSERSEMS